MVFENGRVVGRSNGQDRGNRDSDLERLGRVSLRVHVDGEGEGVAIRRRREGADGAGYLGRRSSKEGTEGSVRKCKCNLAPLVQGRREVAARNSEYFSSIGVDFRIGCNPTHMNGLYISTHTTLYRYESILVSQQRHPGSCHH